MEIGRLFQSLGLAIAKSQCPLCFNLYLGTDKCLYVPDLRALEGLWKNRRSEIYGGTMLFKLRDVQIGAIWSCFWITFNNLAAVYWTVWSHARIVSTIIQRVTVF